MLGDFAIQVVLNKLFHIFFPEAVFIVLSLWIEVIFVVSLQVTYSRVSNTRHTGNKRLAGPLTKKIINNTQGINDSLYLFNKK